PDGRGSTAPDMYSSTLAGIASSSKPGPLVGVVAGDECGAARVSLVAGTTPIAAPDMYSSTLAGIASSSKSGPLVGVKAREMVGDPVVLTPPLRWPAGSTAARSWLPGSGATDGPVPARTVAAEADWLLPRKIVSVGV